MKKALLIFATLLTTLTILNLYWWISCAVSNDSFAETLEVYLGVFPSSLQDGRLIANLSFFSSLIAIGILIYLTAKEFKKIITISLLVINSIIGAWTLFSLM